MNLRTSTSIALLALAACTGPLGALRARTDIVAGTAHFTLRSKPAAVADVARVRAALERAPQRLGTWGGLALPVTISMLDTHGDLETVVGRPYGWLRAWAQYDEVLLQAPSTWTSRDEELEELLVHELTHCLLFQRSASREDWSKLTIPLWFREGMALWTARQASRLPSLEDSARWLDAHPTADVFGDGEALSRDHFEAIYGLSHHAFSFLVRRYGAERVTKLMAAMQRGAPFAKAFLEVQGFSVERFERDFRRWLSWRGFRGWGQPVRPQPAATAE